MVPVIGVQEEAEDLASQVATMACERFATIDDPSAWVDGVAINSGGQRSECGENVMLKRRAWPLHHSGPVAGYLPPSLFIGAIGRLFQARCR